MDSSDIMKKSSLSKNFVFNIAYQVLLYIVPFITTPYLSRVLGAERIGQSSFAQSIVSYFVLFATLGTNLYGQRAIASLRKNAIKRSKVFSEIVLLRFFIVFVSFGLYALGVLPFCSDRQLYLYSAIDIIAVALDISWFFQGSEEFSVITGCSGICKILSVFLVFSLVKKPADLSTYVLIYFGATAIGNLLQWFCLPSHLMDVRTVLKRPTVCFKHLKPALLLFAAQVAIQIYTVLDKTMIGVITKSGIQNGYYEQAQKIIRVLTVLTTSIGTVMASRIAILWKDQKREQIQKLVEQSFRMVFAVGIPVVLGLWLVADRFVPIFYGDGYVGVIPLLKVLVVLIVIVGCSNVIGIQYLIPTGRETYVTRSVMIGAIVNFSLNLIMISRYQAIGAAIASVVAEVVVTIVQFYAIHCEIRIWPFFKIFLRYSIITTIVMVGACLLERIAPPGALGLVVIVAPTAAVYLIVLVLLRDPFLRFFVRGGNDD